MYGNLNELAMEFTKVVCQAISRLMTSLEIQIQGAYKQTEMGLISFVYKY